MYLDLNQFQKYTYDEEKVEEYIAKIKEKNRVPLAIMLQNEMIGEILFKDIKDKSATLSIVMKNTKYKDHGYGTQAERKAIEYAFQNLKVEKLYADAIITNTRSQHVLEKVGFSEIKRDEEFVYYCIEKSCH